MAGFKKKNVLLFTMQVNLKMTLSAYFKLWAIKQLIEFEI